MSSFVSLFVDRLSPASPRNPILIIKAPTLWLMLFNEEFRLLPAVWGSGVDCIEQRVYITASRSGLKMSFLQRRQTSSISASFSEVLSTVHGIVEPQEVLCKEV